MSDFFSELNFVSELGHLFIFWSGRSKTSLEKGMFIVSTDIDVGSPKLGVINKGKRDKDINDSLSESLIGKIEELSIPLIVGVFDNFEIPMTLAVRGQLTETDSRVMDTLLASKVKHDIGAHGYYHTSFTKLTREAAEDELRMISAGMKKYGVVPKTFVFPRNHVAHLELLKKYNYTCYRSNGNIARDRMHIEKKGNLYDVHPSIYINRYTNLPLLKKIIDISIRQRSPLHMWFHFWNFGEDEKSVSNAIKNLFIPLLCYAKSKQENGLLTFQTMLSATQNTER